MFRTVTPLPVCDKMVDSNFGCARFFRGREVRGGREKLVEE